MKKIKIQIFNTLMAVMLCLACGTLFTACSDDDDKDEPDVTEKTGEAALFGTWYASEEEPDEDGDIWFDEYTLILNTDHSGTITDNFGWKTRSTTTFNYSQKFNWKYGVNSNGQEFIDIIVISGDEILEDGKYAISVVGNMLRFGDVTFTR